MSKISILIADDNEDIVEQVRDTIEKYDDMVVAGIAVEGYQVIEMIDVVRPDIVLLDIIMPGIDGLCIMERVLKKHKDKSPVFVVLSGISSDYFIQKVFFAGADYYFVKPYNLDHALATCKKIFLEKKSPCNEDYIRQRTANLLEDSDTCDLKITALLHKMGVYANTEIFYYLREALLMTIHDKLQGNITVELYPRMAKKFKVSVQKVEKVLTEAINDIWMRSRPAPYEMKKPTNSEFICTYAEIVRLSDKIEH